MAAASTDGRSSDPFVQMSLVDKSGWTSGQVLKTEVKDKTLSPQFYHRFCFSRALNLDDKATAKNKKEWKRRREQLRATVDHSLIGPDIEKRRPFGSLDRQDMIFPGLWAETKGSSMMSSSASASRATASGAPRSRWPCRRPSDWLAAARRKPRRRRPRGSLSTRRE